MTHLLIVKNAAGKEIGRVPVEAGYTTKEILLPREEVKVDADKDVASGDAGTGLEKVG